MRQAVQQRHHHAGRVDRRGDGLHGRGQVVGLAGQDDDVEGPVDLAGEQGPHCLAPLLAAGLHHQPVALELRRAGGADQEAHIRTSLGELQPVVAADRPGTQEQDPHRRPPSMAAYDGERHR
jgi:hypothetical protein